MKQPTNKELLSMAIELLSAAKEIKTESVEIDSTNYEDGTLGLSINVVYPAVGEGNAEG